MFIVSALLLDDALKLATALTNGAINETLRHFTRYRLCVVGSLVIVLLQIFC